MLYVFALRVQELIIARGMNVSNYLEIAARVPRLNRMYILANTSRIQVNTVLCFLFACGRGCVSWLAIGFGGVLLMHVHTRAG